MALCTLPVEVLAAEDGIAVTVEELDEAVSTADETETAVEAVDEDEMIGDVIGGMDLDEDIIEESVDDENGEETDAEPSGTCGDSVNWAFSSDTGRLTIYGTGAMDSTWNMEQASWYDLRAAIQTVEIQSGVTSIAPYAFQGCMNLTSISIPATVKTIGQCAFFDCTGLKGVTIPSGVTEIPYRTFYLCAGLEKVSIPSTVKTIGQGAFDGCTVLSDVKLPSGLTSLGKSAFAGCDGITSIVLPLKVTKIEMNAFYGCSNLSAVSIEGDLTSIGAYAFANCTALTHVSFANGTSAIEDGAFRNCISLGTFPMPRKVTSIGKEVFDGCTELGFVEFSNMNMPSGSDWFGSSVLNVVYPQSNSTWTSDRRAQAGANVSWLGKNFSSNVTQNYGTPILKSIENQAGGIKLTWYPVEGVTTYQVFRAATGATSWTNLGRVTGTSFTDSKAASGTAYRYTVRAVKDGSYVSWYDGEGLTMMRLANPTVSLYQNANGVRIDWTKVSGAAGYRVYRRTEGGSWKLLTTTSSANTLRCIDTEIKENSGTTYYYAVRAKNGSYLSGYVSNQTIFYLAQPKVTLEMGHIGIYVRWQQVEGAKYYRIFRKTANSGWQLIRTVDASRSYYADTGIKNNSGTTYYYAVRALSGSSLSTYQTGVSLLYLKQPTPSVKNVTGGIQVSWDKIGDAAGYRIYRKVPGGGWKLLTTVSSSKLNYTDAAVKNNSGSTYIYTVRSVNGKVLSTYHAGVQITRK